MHGLLTSCKEEMLAQARYAGKLKPVRFLPPPPSPSLACQAEEKRCLKAYKLDHILVLRDEMQGKYKQGI
jgi:hypothetical protein